MEGRHWNNDEIVAHYYGVATPDGVHRWEECAACAALWHAFELRRQGIQLPPPVSRERLADIRTGVERRRDAGAWTRWWWAPATVATLCIALMLNLMPHTQKPAEARAMEEILAEASQIEPAAVSAAHFLFVEDSK